VAAALRGGGAAVREKRRGGARDGEEVLLPLYRAEGKGEGRGGGGVGARWCAINGGGGRLGGGRLGGGERPGGGGGWRSECGGVITV
jgi:translation initiation factor IF-2